MTVSVRYRRSHRSQFHLIGTLGHYTIATMQPMQYLHTLAIATAQGDATLLILLLAQLHIYII